MFKAKNNQTGDEIIILDTQWIKQIEALRSLADQDVLVCQGCNQPVRVRKGDLRRAHFAHKSLQNCTYGYESSEVLQARATLYEWLFGKFGNAVTVEKKFDDDRFSRPIDCWVENPSGKFAYWIVESGMRPQKRTDLMRGFDQLDAHITWVFLADTLSDVETENETSTVGLTPTQRDFMQASDYDEIVQGRRSLTGHTLHFLDAEQKMLMTLRGVYLIHRPQRFQGYLRRSNLSEVLVSRSTGEFVHPGEYEKLRETQRIRLEAEKQQREVEKRQRELERQQREIAKERMMREPQSPFREVRQVENLELGKIVSKTIRLKNGTTVDAVHPKILPEPQHEATCISCGSSTTNWVWYVVAKSKCVCNECYSNG